MGLAEATETVEGRRAGGRDAPEQLCPFRQIGRRLIAIEQEHAIPFRKVHLENLQRVLFHSNPDSVVHVQQDSIVLIDKQRVNLVSAAVADGCCVVAWTAEFNAITLRNEATSPFLETHLVQSNHPSG